MSNFPKLQSFRNLVPTVLTYIWKPNNEFIKLIKIRNADVHFDTRKTINIRYHNQQPIRSNILVCLIPLRLFFYPPDLEVFFICPFWKKKSFGSSIFMEDLWQYSYMLKWEITCVVSLMSSHFFAIVIVMAERFSVSLTNTYLNVIVIYEYFN